MGVQPFSCGVRDVCGTYPQVRAVPRLCSVALGGKWTYAITRFFLLLCHTNRVSTSQVYGFAVLLVFLLFLLIFHHP